LNGIPIAEFQAAYRATIRQGQSLSNPRVTADFLLGDHRHARQGYSFSTVFTRPGPSFLIAWKKAPTAPATKGG
jgi:hypothetical protein